MSERSELGGADRIDILARLQSAVFALEHALKFADTPDADSGLVRKIHLALIYTEGALQAYQAATP